MHMTICCLTSWCLMATGYCNFVLTCLLKLNFHTSSNAAFVSCSPPPSCPPPAVQVRMPSNMQGNKNKANEGGIRTFLAVTGPGVAAGVIDSTLLQAPDQLPTIADLAGLTRTDEATRLNPTGGLNPSQPPKTLNPDHASLNPAAQTPQWDGLSFKHLLLPVQGAAAQSKGGSGYRGDVLATVQQRERYVFALSAHCWSSDAVAKLNRNRCVGVATQLGRQSRGVGRSNFVCGPIANILHVQRLHHNIQANTHMLGGVGIIKLLIL